MINPKMLQEISQSINNQFGESIAKLYGKFYKEKENYQVLEAFKILMTEAIGPKKANEQYLRLKKKYKIKKTGQSQIYAL